MQEECRSQANLQATITCVYWSVEFLFSFICNFFQDFSQSWECESNIKIQYLITVESALSFLFYFVFFSDTNSSSVFMKRLMLQARPMFLQSNDTAGQYQLFIRPYLF